MALVVMDNSSITLADPNRHGIVNGGHTYAAIRDAIEDAEELQLKSLSRAYVRLHVLQGIEDSKVAEIVEGLNRSKRLMILIGKPPRPF